MVSFFNVGFLGLLVAFALAANVDAKPKSCKTHTFIDKIDWDRTLPDVANIQPFQAPGVIVLGPPNITFPEILNFAGLLWNADTFQELNGLVCTHYGPYIYAVSGEENVKTECNRIVTSLNQNMRSDVYEDCIGIFSSLIEAQGPSSLIFDMWDSLGISDYVCQDGGGNECELQALVLSHVTDSVELVSRLAFSVLDWLGPSPFSGDVYGACSGLRLLAGMQIDDIFDRLKLIASYVVADGLQRFSEYNGCEVTDENILQIVNYLLFPEQSDGGFCQLLAGSQSDEDYQNLAEEIVNTLSSVLVEEDQCLNILTLLDGMDLPGIPFMVLGVTGFNISKSNDRQTFCTELTTSLSSRGTYTPFPYDPADIGSEWQPLMEQGELLPNFTIMDAVDVVGAFFRSNTLADGATVLCDVFGSLASQVTEGGDVSQLCDALQETDTAAVEQICRELAVPLQYPPGHLPSLRVPTQTYMIVTGVDMLRRLVELEALSPEYGCTALDDFLRHDDNTPQSVVRFALDAYLAELLPIAHDFCNNYDVIMAYLRTRADLSEENFSALTDEISDLIFTHFGFGNRNELCAKISNGISEASGRASDSLTSYFAEEAILFLTDQERCVDTIDTSMRSLTDALGEAVDSTVMYAVTGYQTTADLCTAMASSFNGEAPVERCEEGSGATVIGRHRVLFLTLMEILLLVAVLMS